MAVSMLLVSFGTQANTEEPPTNYRPNVEEPAYIAQDKARTVDERVIALESLRTRPSKNGLVAVARALKEDNPQIKQAAIIGSAGFSIALRWKMLTPLLADSSTATSNEALFNLLSGGQEFTAEQKEIIRPYLAGLEQYLLEDNTSYARFRLARFYQLTADNKKAISLFKQLTLEVPTNQAVWVSYAEVYHKQGKDKASLDILNAGLKSNPNSSQLHYAKGLALVRDKEKRLALEQIKVAAILAESNSYYWYLYGVMQKEFDIAASVPLFEQAYQLSGAPEQMYALCEVYLETDNINANACLAELKKVAPKNAIEQLLQKLKL